MLSGPSDDFAAQSHDRLEAIIETAMDAIISVDEEQRIICFNPAAERMFEIGAKEVLGTPIERFIPERYHDEPGPHISRFIDTGETGRAMSALSAVRADGQEFPVEASISQATVGSERMSTVILRDITERKANEDAQAMLAREVDHRAKNILAIVASLVSLTQAPTRQAYAESLAGRIAALSRAHGLLSRARWQGVSLRQVASEELGSYADVRNFVCEGPDLNLSPRAVQPIGMMIHELATNAFKHGALTSQGGRVHLSWSDQPDGLVKMAWAESGGPPVQPPLHAGFGSNLIQQIVEHQLSGKLEHHWGIGGYRLGLTLPESILELASERHSPARTMGKGNGPIPAQQARPTGGASSHLGTLLIVEDEPLLAMQLSKSLTDFGWSIFGVAGSIEEANRILSEHKRPDAAILDVDLAGMPVFPLARSLRRLGIPFLFCTGYEDLDYVQEFAGCQTIRKPATVLQIVRGLRDVVRTAGAELATAPNG